MSRPWPIPALLGDTGVEVLPFVKLVESGVKSSLLTLQRAQVAGVSAMSAVDGVWTQYAADLPRVTGSPQRFLLERSRFNNVTNARASGSAGVLPTGWTTNAAAQSISTSITYNTEDGLPYVQLVFTGSPGAGTLEVNFPGTPAASIGQTWVGSVFTRLASGSTANISNPALRFGVVGASPIGVSLPTTPLGTARQSITVTAGSGTTQAPLSWQCTLTGGPINIGIRFAAPQSEQASFATTPILQPAGTTAAASRGSDFVTATLASLGIASNGSCTLFWSGRFQVPANTTVFQLDGGSNTNRYTLDITGANALRCFGAGGTANGTLPTFDTVAANTAYKLGVAIDGALGRIAASFNGATPVVSTGTILNTALTTLRLGRSATSEPSQDCGQFWLLPNRVLQDSKLASVTSRIPN